MIIAKYPSERKSEFSIGFISNSYRKNDYSIKQKIFFWHLLQILQLKK